MLGPLIPQSIGFDEDSEIGRIARKTNTYAEQVQDVWNMAQRARNWYANKTRWVVSIEAGDRLYDIVLRWLITDSDDRRPARNIKASMKVTRPSRYADYDDDLAILNGRGPGERSVQVTYDEKAQRTITLAGHKVVVFLHKFERPKSTDGSFVPVQNDNIQFFAQSYEAQQAVINKLDSLAKDTGRRKPALSLMSQWGDWMRRDDLPERQLDSVILRAGQMERLRDDLEAFMREEPNYARRALPYHRGYMLHGPPGTGKTSIVRALAAHFGLDLWYAPLGDLQKDSSLLTLINQVRPGSILLLEDVDVFHAMKSREEEGGSVSMAGLLNALDGVATPHGLITFMTTNDLDVIDPALIRPGRVDMLEEIGMPDQDQIRRLFNFWCDEEMSEGTNKLITYKGSPAEVTEVFKRNLDDRDAAWAQLILPANEAEERSVTVDSMEDNRERTGRAG